MKEKIPREFVRKISGFIKVISILIILQGIWIATPYLMSENPGYIGEGIGYIIGSSLFAVIIYYGHKWITRKK